MTRRKYVHIREDYLIDITNDIPSTPDTVDVNSATPSGHCECYVQITVMMPGAEDHIIVQSQGDNYLMIDYFTNFTLEIPIMRLYDYNPKSRLHC